jgi:primary-amine oxidase
MPFVIPDTICIFERDTGNPSWRHYEIFAQSPEQATPAEGRPAKELIVRYASEVGNYDYLVDYIFQQDGTIRMAVGSTGLDAVKGVASTSMKDATAEMDTMFGTLISPNLVAPNHDHYFNFRLDFDIEGEANSFQKSRLVPYNATEDVPRKSFWKVEKETVTNEMAARTKVNPMTPSSFYFVNTNEESSLGHNPAYQLIPGGSYAYSQMLSEDVPVARNAYIENPLWVTPYDPNQIYAGGEYAVKSNGTDTLKTWTEEDRSIDNEDIVAWYTVGFHHVPRMEDWPVMPTHWAEFQIRPFNFFGYNPAITLAPPSTTTGQDATSDSPTSEDANVSEESSSALSLCVIPGFALFAAFTAMGIMLM